jgi:hypothetical protein
LVGRLLLLSRRGTAAEENRPQMTHQLFSERQFLALTASTHVPTLTKKKDNHFSHIGQGFLF